MAKNRQNQNQTGANPVENENLNEQPVAEETPVETPVVEPTPEPTEPPTQAPTPEPTVVTQPAPAIQVPPVTQNTFDQMVVSIKESGSISEKMLVDSLERYVTRMSPGVPMSSDKGAAEQVALIKVIRNLIENNPAEFPKLWRILSTFHTRYINGVFAVTNIFRFIESISLDKDQVSMFQNLMTMLDVINSKETGFDRKQYGDFIGNATRVGISPDGAQRILAYYNL